MGRRAPEHRLTVAINLGMYQTDHSTHVGYLRNGAHVNSRRWLASYQAALAFGPRRKGLPPLLFADLDRRGFKRSVASMIGTI
jgi:hypothetical protein